jgi:hypothetical protein
MEPIVHRGRAITLHRHGPVAIEVRIDGVFAAQWTLTEDTTVRLVTDSIDTIDAHPDGYRRMKPCWYRLDDPRRAEAERFHGVPLHHPPIDAPTQPG